MSEKTKKLFILFREMFRITLFILGGGFAIIAVADEVFAKKLKWTKEGELIERALKKFKRKFEKTGIVKELRARQAFEKPSVTNRKKMMKAIYVQQLRAVED